MKLMVFLSWFSNTSVDVVPFGNWLVTRILSINRISSCPFQNLLPKCRRGHISKFPFPLPKWYFCNYGCYKYDLPIKLCYLLLINNLYEQLYVIGSSTKLGKWKVQDGLKLCYSGESIWQVDCALLKGDFPIKYPFFFSGIW